MPSSGHGCDRAAVRAGTVDAPGLDRGVHGHRGRPRDRWCRRPARDVRTAAHVESVVARRGDRRRIHDRGVQPGDALPAAGDRRHRSACGPRVPRDAHMAPRAVASMALGCVRRARRRRAADPARWARLPAAGTVAVGDRVLHRDPCRVRVRDQRMWNGGSRKRTTSQARRHPGSPGCYHSCCCSLPGRSGSRWWPSRSGPAWWLDRSRWLRSSGVRSRSSGSAGSRWRRCGVRIGRARARHRRDPVTVLPTSFRGTCARSRVELGELAFEQAPFGVVVHQRERTPIRIAGFVRASQATQQLAPRGMQVVVVLEAKAFDDVQARLRTLRLSHRHGPAQLHHRRTGELRELAVQRCDLWPVARLLGMQ